MANAVTIIVNERNKTLKCTETVTLGSTCVFSLVDEFGNPLAETGACVLRLLPKPHQRGRVEENAPYGAFSFTNGVSEPTNVFKEAWLVDLLSHLPIDTTAPVHATIVTEAAGPIATGTIDILVTTVAEAVETETGSARAVMFKGDKGDTGEALTFEMLTDEQKEALRGEQGEQGVQGVKGDKGDPNVYVGDNPPLTASPFTLWVNPDGEPTGFPTLPTDGNVGDVLFVSKKEDDKILVGWGNVSGAEGSPYVPSVRETENGTFLDFTYKGETVIVGDQNLKGADGKDGVDGKDGEDGEDGSYFTPSVSAEGEISWENNKGLEPPPPVSLMDVFTALAPSALCDAMLKNANNVETVVIGNGVFSKNILLEKHSYVFINFRSESTSGATVEQCIFANIGGVQTDDNTIMLAGTMIKDTSSAARKLTFSQAVLPRGTILTYASTTLITADHNQTCTIKIIPLE